MNPKFLVGLALVASSCFSLARAKRDYDQYPEYRKEIADYNLQTLLGDLCHTETFEFSPPNHFHCDGRSYTSNPICDFALKDIQKVTYTEGNVLIQGIDDECRIGCRMGITGGKEQCLELEEAFNIYLGKK